MSLADAGRMGGENPGLKCELFYDPGNNLPAGGSKRPEIRELSRVGERWVSKERRRLRDRLSYDRNAQDLFKRFPGKCNH